MGPTKRLKAWVASAGAAVSVLFLLWSACTQKNPINPTSPVQAETFILVHMSASPARVSVGGGEAEIRVRLVNKEGEPAADEPVHFSTTMGTVTQLDTTDADGWAVGLFSSGSQAGQATITARYGQIASLSTLLEIISSSSLNLQISLSPQTILANGRDKSRILVTALDDSAKPRSGAEIRFEQSAGTLSASTVRTTSEGTASVWWTAPSSEQDINATITAYSDSLSVASMIVFRGVQLSLSVQPRVIYADQESTSLVNALVKETSSRIAVSGDTVWFSATEGLVPNMAVTDSRGLASVHLTSSASPDTALVTAHYGPSLSAQDTVVFVSEAEGLMTIQSLNLSSAVLYANGENYSMLHAKVVDSENNPASGVTVNFTCDPVDIPGVPAAAQRITGSDGIASFAVQPGDISQDYLNTTVSAHLDVPSESESVHLHIYQVSLGVTATPAYLPADGKSTSQIQAVLKRASNNVAVTNQVIRFGTDRGTVDSEATTNSAGVASASLRSSDSADTADVTVHYGIIEADPYPLNVIFYAKEEAATHIESLTASTTTIYANGQNAASVEAVVKTAEGLPASGVTVNFTTVPGTLPGVDPAFQAVTNGSGVAVFTMTPDDVSGDVNATVSAYLSDPAQSFSVQIAVIKVVLTVTAVPSEILADGQSQSAIRAVLKRQSSQVGINGETIVFGTDVGTIPGSGTTNSSGVAQVSLTSTSIPDTAHVRVTYGDIQADPFPCEVIFRQTQGQADNINLSAYLTSGGDPSSPIDELPADGSTSATIRAIVKDANGNPVGGKTVSFSTSIGDITGSAQTNSNGISEAQFSSSVVGVAEITARVQIPDGSISESITLRLLPGAPATVLLRFDPTSMGVKDSGKNQTVTVYAEVKDSKNNSVQDDTKVQFSIVQSPGGGVAMSPASGTSIPTVGGIAQCSFSSGTISGVAKIQAEVVEDAQGTPLPPGSVRSIATELVIFAGPAYMENIADSSTTHLTILPRRLNIYAGLDTTFLTVSVSDKYFNEVQEGTAIYVTTTGGKVIMDNPQTHPNTDDNGIATFIIQAQDPYPDTTRWFNTFMNPNFPGEIIHGDPFDFNNDGIPNNGIARILAYTDGSDDNGADIKVWNVCEVVMSHNVSHFLAMSDRDTLTSGQSAAIDIEIWDKNGNPVVGGSLLSASIAPSSAPAELSWTQKITADPGSCFYRVYLYNTINPTDPEARPTNCTVTISIQSPNGNAERSVSVYLDI